MIARAEGVCSPIFSTQRHLAKSAPSFLYWAQRSDSPSSPGKGVRSQSMAEEEASGSHSSWALRGAPTRWGWLARQGAKQFSPWVVVSPFVPARGTTPLSTCWVGQYKAGEQSLLSPLEPSSAPPSPNLSVSPGLQMFPLSGNIHVSSEAEYMGLLFDR